MRPCAAHSAPATLLRLRGGVRELEDYAEWVLEEAGNADKLLVVDFTRSRRRGAQPASHRARPAPSGRLL